MEQQQPNVGISQYANIETSDDAQNAMADLGIDLSTARSILDSPNRTRWLSDDRTRMLSTREDGDTQYVIEHAPTREETPEGLPAIMHTTIESVYTLPLDETVPGFKGGDHLRYDDTGGAITAEDENR